MFNSNSGLFTDTGTVFGTNAIFNTCAYAGSNSYPCSAYPNSGLFTDTGTNAYSYITSYFEYS